MVLIIPVDGVAPLLFDNTVVTVTQSLHTVLFTQPHLSVSLQACHYSQPSKR